MGGNISDKNDPKNTGEAKMIIDIIKRQNKRNGRRSKAETKSRWRYSQYQKHNRIFIQRHKEGQTGKREEEEKNENKQNKRKIK